MLFDIAAKKQFIIDNALFPNAFSITQPVWRKNSKAFTFEYNQRGWAHLYLYEGATAVKNQITKGQWVVRCVDTPGGNALMKSNKKFDFLFVLRRWPGLRRNPRPATTLRFLRAQSGRSGTASSAI